MNVAFITNGNSTIGFGHISRTLMLYSFFKKNSHYTKIIVPETCIFTENEDFIKTKSFSEFDLNPFLQEFDVIIIDSIEEDFDSLFWIGKTNLFVVSITLFLFPFSKRYEHLSFFPSIQQSEVITTGKTEIYKGNQYLTFRNEFENTKFVVKEKADKILITMGGTDPNGLTIQVLNALKNDDKLIITILLSEKSKDYQEISEISDFYPNINLIGFTNDMVNLFVNNDIAIINGGLTRYETCVVGIPFIALSIHDKQFGITKELTDLGVGINLGVYNQISDSQIYKTVQELLSNSALRQTTSIKMRELIDTKGVERMYNIICNKFQEYESNNKVG